MSDNPLLDSTELPLLGQIRPEHVNPAVQQILDDNRSRIAELLAAEHEPTWCGLAEPLEAMDGRLSDAWAPVSHLQAVQTSQELRSAYEQALPLLTAYQTELGQNRALFESWQALSESPESEDLQPAHKKAIANQLRDFRLAGVSLSDEDKSRYAELQQSLAQLGSTFSNNVLDATQGWHKHLSDLNRLSGVPENVIATLCQNAVDRNLEGYVLSLELPSYLPVMQYANDRALREELYRAYSTRASEQEPNAGCWDNSEIMSVILAARHEMACLLGFDNYAELSLATKMAASPAEVMAFLESLAEKARPIAERELADLTAFATGRDGLTRLEAWDIPYYTEQLRLSRYAISQQELRPYFPFARVLEGLFAVATRLFGVEFELDESVERYHHDVRCYRVVRDGVPVSGFYLDPFARQNKRGGAWMGVCRQRRVDCAGKLSEPIAFLVCNFTAPEADKQALLTHDEVITLFHEFGHGLHHMLTRADVAAVSGINGVAWDAVELPSQFLENWCWNREALDLISGHVETGEPLSGNLLDKLLQARNFQAGLAMMRQLEFAAFDFKLHMDYRPEDPVPIQETIDSVRKRWAVINVPPFNRFQHSFSHIFAGGYAAGYYSYKWAEQLSSDAFSRFEEEGIFNADTGRSFLHEVLEVGGSRDAADSFEAFRGRGPDSSAMLRHCGITQTEHLARGDEE